MGRYSIKKRQRTAVPWKLLAISLVIVAAGALSVIIVGNVSAPAAKPKSARQSSVASSVVAHPRTPATTVLFSAPLNGQNGILANEYSYWNPNSSCPYKSSVWQMTSGTLSIKNNAGYSGIPTVEKHSTCSSTTHTDSAIFRLNTTQNNFSNVDVSMDYMAAKHGGGGAPNNSYDGIHMWVGYQNEYALYAATIFRWDGNLVIKKKVPLQTAHCTNPSNEGCYYNVTAEKKYANLTTANIWRHADILFQPNSDGSTTITTKIDGNVIMQAVDKNLHGPAYKSGAVGVRGDNTEFYFKNFTVNKI
jgi:hypothetical protein